MLLDELQVAQCEIDPSCSSIVSSVVLRTEQEECNERNVIGLCESGSVGNGQVVGDCGGIKFER